MLILAKEMNKATTDTKSTKPSAMENTREFTVVLRASARFRRGIVVENIVAALSDCGMGVQSVCDSKGRDITHKNSVNDNTDASCDESGPTTPRNARPRTPPHFLNVHNTAMGAIYVPPPTPQSVFKTSGKNAPEIAIELDDATFISKKTHNSLGRFKHGEMPVFSISSTEDIKTVSAIVGASNKYPFQTCPDMLLNECDNDYCHYVGLFKHSSHDGAEDAIKPFNWRKIVVGGEVFWRMFLASRYSFHFQGNNFANPCIKVYDFETKKVAKVADMGDVNLTDFARVKAFKKNYSV